MSETEFDFPLTQDFSYSHKGDQVDARFIKLTAPTSRHSKECAALKQAFFRAQNSFVAQARESDAEPSGEKITGDDVIMMMAASKDVDLPDVFDVARKLFTSGTIAVVDGEPGCRLTSALVDKMSQEDFEVMLGEYLVNFTLASSLEKMNDKSSQES